MNIHFYLGIGVDQIGSECSFSTRVYTVVYIMMLDRYV